MKFLEESGKMYKIIEEKYIYDDKDLSQKDKDLMIGDFLMTFRKLPNSIKEEAFNILNERIKLGSI